MELFYTGEDFRLQGVPHGGVPFLLDSKMREVVAINDYLFHIAVVRGRTASPATWKASAESLYDFFSYLEANDLNVNNYNNFSAQPNEDGSHTIHFGGCDDGRVNCIPITAGWNYANRMYGPRQEILKGEWVFPLPAIVD